ncbi:RagB/SusD family nutrient uptake outer membrane protein [Bacteroidota bacterium]
MKNFIFILFISTLLVSCEDFLNLQPVSEIGEGNFYKTTEELEKVLVGCYTTLQETVEHEWLLSEFRSDNTLYNPSFSSGRLATMFALDVFNVTAENEYVDNFYTAAYSSIGSVNTLLNYQDVISDSTMKGHLTGQARFIRAYQYFNLVRLFGPVFLANDKLNSGQANEMYRSTEEQVYNQIINDLEFASNNINDSLYTDNDAGRVTTWAAKTLLAKVHLTLGDNDTVKQILEDVMLNSGHSLLSSYGSVFSNDNEMNNEIIFAIRFQSNAGGLGNPLSTLFAPNGIEDVVVKGSGRGYNYPATELLDEYLPADARKAASVYDPFDASTHAGISEQINANFIKKYIASQPIDYDSDADFIVLRYADVILMYAEAVNELEGFATATPYLNQIRNRANLSSIFPDSEHQFRLALERERRLEFAFENHRWYDLLRSNRVNAVMSSHFIKASEYGLIAGEVYVPEQIESWKELLPIPQSQIDINPGFSQNFGY